jgi:glucosylceramidase
MIKIIRSSKAGERLKEVATLKSKKEIVSNRILFIDEAKTYQTHAGFGGALTEATTAILNKMTKAQKQIVLEAYFSKSGLNYNLARITILVTLVMGIMIILMDLIQRLKVSV